jgi:cytoskeletal protein CcmA (bactofilin family)
MWKSNRTLSPAFESGRDFPGASMPESSSSPESSARLAFVASGQSSISKGLIFTGDITGSESLVIDGKVEGRINLPGSRVTVGHTGEVEAGIAAGEVVVEGRIRGNVSAFTLVEVHSDGALTGDVTTTRISIEDGAFFKGGIDIRKPEPASVSEASFQAEADTPFLQ